MSVRAVMFSVSWIAGIILGHVAPVAAALAIGIVVAVLASRAAKEPLSSTCAALALASLGAVHASAAIPAVNEAKCSFQTSLPVAATVDRVGKRASTASYIIEQPNGCRWWVSTSPWPPATEGQQVKVVGGGKSRVAELTGAPGFASYLEKQHIAGTWQRPELSILDTQAPAMLAIREQLVQRSRTIFLEPAASVIAAMLFADKTTLPRSVTDSAQATGVAHIFAISGLHISLIATLLLILAHLLPLSPTAKTALVISTLWIYVLLIGAPASAIRAGLFWSCTLTLLRLTLLTSVPTAILLTATIVFSIAPSFVGDLGFRLSLAAVTGIFLAFFITKPYRHRIRAPLPLFLTTSLLLTGGATLTTWPLISLYFGTVSVISPLANLIIVPAVPLLVSLSVLSLIASYVYLPAGLLVAGPVNLLASYLIYMTERLGAWSYSSINLSISTQAAMLYYGALAAAAIAVVSGLQKRSWREIWE